MRLVYLCTGWGLSALLFFVIIAFFGWFIVLPVRDGTSSWLLNLIKPVQMM